MVVSAPTRAMLDGPARTHAAARGAVAPLRVERIAASELASPEIARIRTEWADLAARALEPNIFLHPDFALPLLRNGTRRSRADLILVRDGSSRLIGLLPVALPRLPTLGLARGFAHEQACLGLPLLDRERAAAAFAAMLDWLATRRPRPAALILTQVPADGRFARDVLPVIEARGRVEVLASRRRAALCTGGTIRPLTSARSRKERARQRRRLGDKGTRTYSSARTPEAVGRACEAFLALEGMGWKGARGTALAADPARATFARDMTRQLAGSGRCRIDALEIGGRPVAMGIVLTEGDQAYFWKTAFDPALAALSPGVQFALALAEAQLGEPGLALTDSCAVPDHPMINRLWPDRLEMCDFAIALETSRSPAFVAGLASERLRQRARAGAKRLRADLGRAGRRFARLRRIRPGKGVRR